MAGLPWVRLDSNIHSHDKVLSLLDDPSPKKHHAFTLYICGLAWSCGHGTDGAIPKSALKAIHGTPVLARLLVKYRLWDESPAGWKIVNYADRQQLSDETYTVRKSQHLGGIKGNCVRHHGPDCGCWKQATA